MHPPKFQHLNHFNDYVFDCYLDEGGMSTVYKAFHQPTGEFRAIKKLKVEFMSDYQIRSKFQSEFVIMKNLDSENVIRVHDFISNGTDEAYSMELIDGTTLKKKLKEPIEFEDEEKLRWMEGLLKALMHIHEKGITHRDVKPGNVFLTNDRVIKLGDFGIAKDAKGVSGILHDHTMYAMAPGTFPYISPEQFKMDPTLDCRSDIYAAGMVMWELGKVERAFKNSTHSQGQDVLENQPGTCGNEHWDKIISKAVHKNRDERYKDAKGFHKEIQKLIEDTGPDPGPDPPQPPESNLEHYLLLSMSTLIGILVSWLIIELLKN